MEPSRTAGPLAARRVLSTNTVPRDVFALCLRVHRERMWMVQILHDLTYQNPNCVVPLCVYIIHIWGHAGFCHQQWRSVIEDHVESGLCKVLSDP